MFVCHNSFNNADEKRMKNPQILIVEDNPVAIKLLRSFLGQDYGIRVAQYGEMALTLLGEYTPDIILLDISLPGMDGLEVCEAIKADEQNREIPVIFITGDNDMNTKLTAFDLGAVDYIEKPFHRAEVLARVKTHTSLGRITQQLKQKNSVLRDAYRQAEQSIQEINEQSGNDFQLILKKSFTKKKKSQIRKSKDIQNDLLDLLFDKMKFGVLATVLNLTLLSIALWPVADRYVLLGWLAVNILTNICRMLLLAWYRKTDPEARKHKPFLPAFLSCVTISAVSFSSVCFLILPYVPVDCRALIVIIMGGMVAGSVGSLTANLPAAYLFVSIVSLSVTVATFMLGDKISIIIGLTCVAFWVLMISVVRIIHYSILTSVSFRYENVDLITYLAKQNRETEKFNKKLEYLSLHDPLTGLKNRHYLFEKLNAELYNFRTTVEPLADGSDKEPGLIYGFLLLDIDHFKRVNDTYGHDAGDTVLKELSLLLEETTRGEDVVIRWGGEEFLVILKNTQDHSLAQMAEKIRKSIQALEISVSRKKTISKTCSIGYVRFPFCRKFPAAISFEDTVNLADYALYHAKENGRNRAVRISVQEERVASEYELININHSIETAVKEGIFVLS